jgi:hypothetical protein
VKARVLGLTEVDLISGLPLKLGVFLEAPQLIDFTASINPRH